MSYIGNVKVGSTTHLVGSTLYGTCATAAGTAAKVVTCADFDQLLTGITIHVKFTYANGVANPTLNVNGTGAKNIYRYGTTAPSTSAKTSWQAGSVVSFTYDGTYWMMNDWLNDDTTYSTASLGFGVGVCSTAAATAAKIVYLSGYTLKSGGIVSVKFQYAVPANATLNINSRGAYNIYHRGSRILADVIAAGDTATFYYGSDGTNNGYHLISVDSETLLPARFSVLASNLESTVIQIDTSAFSSLPVTITDSSISDAHVLLRETLSNPAAQTSDWTITTAVGSLTISGSISGSTTASFVLGIPWNNLNVELF